MNDDLKDRLAATEGHTDGPWEVVISPREDDGRARYFPHIVIGYKPGMLYSDGSGSDEHMKRDGSITINSVAGGAPMAVHEANAHLLHLAPELKAEILRQDALIEELVEALAAPTHDVNDYNCEDWLPEEGCAGCEGDELRRDARAKAKEQS